MIKLVFALALCLFAVGGSAPCASAQQVVTKQTGISEIHFERTGCYGKCPVDKVILRSDGTASYIGKMYVEKIGQYKGTFNRKDFYRLAQFLQTQRFFDLKAHYNPQIKDAFGGITTVIRRGEIKEVAVEGDDKPIPLWNIEKAILGVAAEVTWKKDETGIRGQTQSGPTFTSIPPGPLNNSPLPNATIVVKRASDKREITRQRADGSGRFQIPLPVGNYLLVPLPNDTSRPFPKGAPLLVAVKSNVSTNVILQFDTGVRYQPKQKQ